MNFQSSDYLPDTEKRIARIREIIAGRPVAILAAGPSIKELEERISELRNADICYFGINTFFVQEDHILKKIGKSFSVIIEATLIKDDKDTQPIIFEKVVSFLDRKDNNMLISSLTSLRPFLDKYDKKLLSPFFVNDNRNIPNNDHPLHLINGNSLSGMICLAVIGKASKIILWGADGYTLGTDAEKIYYRPGEYYPSMEKSSEPQQQLIRNTNKGFNPIVPISLRNIYKTYQLEPVPILNCSEVSFLTPFPKVSYNDTFDVLLGKKGIEEIKDLRVPTASIIIPHSINNKELENTLKNIGEQSYSNYEKLLIQRKYDSDFLETMKKALFSARGKYIFYCPSGNIYNDHDWINSCLEVLENRPPISLVCGLSKDVELPWPKKKFLYYWLKRKIIFPPNMLCVRKQVLEKCLFQNNSTPPDSELESWLNFNLNFNVDGYLPTFITTMNEPHKYTTNDSRSLLDNYERQIDDYRNQLVFKKVVHHYKNGDGNILPGKFYLSAYLLPEFLYPLLNGIKRRL